jgi:ketosteroid isomerase-like protein
MIGENIDIVKGTYESFAEGDVEAVMGSFAPDITWVEAEGGPYGGIYEGSEEIAESVFAPLGGEWEDFRVVPDRFVRDGDTVVTTGTYSGTYRETSQSFESPFAHVWELEDGDIVRFEQYVDTALHSEPLPE